MKSKKQEANRVVTLMNGDILKIVTESGEFVYVYCINKKLVF